SMRFQIAAPAQTVLDATMVLSPDGRKLVFSATGSNSDARRQLWLREIDALAARPLVGTLGAVRGAFWSPDSKAIAFPVDGAGRGTLKRIDIATGVVQTLSPYPGNFRGGAWSRGGAILLSSSQLNGLMRLSQAGGELSPVTAVDTRQQDTLPV